MRFGVIDNAGVVLDDGKSLFRVNYDKAITTMGDFVKVCSEVGIGIKALWVTPGSSLSEQYKQGLIEDEGSDFVCWRPDSGATYSVTCKGKSVVVVFPEHQPNYYLTDVTSSTLLYRILHTYEIKVGVPLLWSPMSAGKKLMEDLHTGSKRMLIERPAGDISVFHKQVIDIQWKRELTEEELGKKYVIGMDKSSAYLTASGGAYLGYGEFSHCVRPKFNNKQAGLWHIEFTEFLDDYNPDYPMFFKGEKSGWLYTPMVNAAITAGYRFEVLEAYLFENSTTIFRTWYERLRDAKKALAAGMLDNSNPELCKRLVPAVKGTYTQFIGVISSKKVVREKTPWYYRPDWRNTIASESMFRAFLAMRKAIAAGIKPFAVNIDCVYFAVDDPNQIIPGFTDNPAYKREHCFHMSDAKSALMGNIYEMNSEFCDLKEVA